MKKNFSEMPLRSGVGIIVLNKENKVFVAKRIDNPKNFWQMPQGGVDEGENFLSAAYRELEEETSIKNVELIKELDGTITYELPDRLLGIIWKGKYRGQKQKWFLMKFTGEEEQINIKTKNPEFLDWKWIDLDQITEVVVDFKLHVYKELKYKVKKILIERS
ncbi:RNA pyrophosphohydrolase [Candidatus Pelagibacter sp.]|jgi:putative (di)nucleoside polyphosphate hydrolase|nr:RNA pyrophosphohydrolase [Candidatus Pelagibacter sp.]